MSVRNPKVLGIWGQDGRRAIAAETYWRLPFAWDRDAATAGERRRVFCASLADVFEGDESMPEADRIPVCKARLRLMDAICRTPNLDWLLLTKRPENVMPLVEQCELDSQPGETCEMLNSWLRGNPPDNVWLGTSVEDQQRADERIPRLLNCPAAVRFLSCEPLLGALSLMDMPCEPTSENVYMQHVDPLRGWYSDRPGKCGAGCGSKEKINWVIVGGESGPGARPMHPRWARSIRDQCVGAGVPFFYKQTGEWVRWTECPRELLGAHREEISIPGEAYEMWLRVGKKAAGRLLDGRAWDEFPHSTPAATAPFGAASGRIRS